MVVSRWRTGSGKSNWAGGLEISTEKHSGNKGNGAGVVGHRRGKDGGCFLAWSVFTRICGFPVHIACERSYAVVCAEKDTADARYESRYSTEKCLIHMVCDTGCVCDSMSAGRREAVQCALLSQASLLVIAIQATMLTFLWPVVLSTRKSCSCSASSLSAAPVVLAFSS